MEKESLEIDDLFKENALEIVYDEFVSFKAMIDGKLEVKKIKDLLEFKLNYLPVRLREKYIPFAYVINKTISMSFLDDLGYVNHFDHYTEYLRFTCLGLLKERKIEL